MDLVLTRVLSVVEATISRRLGFGWIHFRQSYPQARCDGARRQTCSVALVLLRVTFILEMPPSSKISRYIVAVAHPMSSHLDTYCFSANSYSLYQIAVQHSSSQLLNSTLLSQRTTVSLSSCFGIPRSPSSGGPSPCLMLPSIGSFSCLQRSLYLFRRLSGHLCFQETSGPTCPPPPSPHSSLLPRPLAPLQRA